MTPQELKELRKSLGMTQAAFAKETGVTIMCVSYCERGKRNIGKHFMKGIKMLMRRKEAKK